MIQKVSKSLNICVVTVLAISIILLNGVRHAWSYAALNMAYGVEFYSKHGSIMYAFCSCTLAMIIGMIAYFVVRAGDDEEGLWKRSVSIYIFVLICLLAAAIAGYQEWLMVWNISIYTPSIVYLTVFTTAAAFSNKSAYSICDFIIRFAIIFVPPFFIMMQYDSYAYLLTVLPMWLLLTHKLTKEKRLPAKTYIVMVAAAATFLAVVFLQKGDVISEHLAVMLDTTESGDFMFNELKKALAAAPVCGASPYEIRPDANTIMPAYLYFANESVVYASAVFILRYGFAGIGYLVLQVGLIFSLKRKRVKTRYGQILLYCVSCLFTTRVVLNLIFCYLLSAEGFFLPLSGPNTAVMVDAILIGSALGMSSKE